MEFQWYRGSLNLQLWCELLSRLKTPYEESLMIYVEASKQNDQSHILSKRVIGIFLVPIFINQSNYFHGKGEPLLMDLQGLNYCFRVFDPGKEFQLMGRCTCLVRVIPYQDIRGCVFTEESIIRDSSKLYEFFKQSDIIWAILILQKVYNPTGIWSSRLIILFKLQDGIQGLQVCSHMVMLLFVENDGKLLRKSVQATMGPGLFFLNTLEVARIFVCLKRGYGGVGYCERRIEIKEMLNKSSAGEISRLEGLEEKLKEVMLGIFIEEEDAAQLFPFIVTQTGILIKAMRTIRGEDFIIGLQLKDWPANNRGALFAESTQIKKQETVAILNYFVRGILSLVNSRQCSHCHNRVFFWTGIYEWRVEIIHSRSIETNGIVCGDDKWNELFTQIHIKVLRDRSWSSSDLVANYSVAVYFWTNKNNSTEKCIPWSLNSIPARDCRLFPSIGWQQLSLTVGGRNLGRYVVLPANTFQESLTCIAIPAHDSVKGHINRFFMHKLELNALSVKNDKKLELIHSSKEVIFSVRAGNEKFSVLEDT